MDYTALANELLSTRCQLRQVPASKHLDKMLRGELFVLNYLATHEGRIHPKELSRELSVSTARIASLLNHMEQKGYVRREQDCADSRQILVVLTAQGQQALEDVKPTVLAYVAATLEALGPEDAHAYVRIQKKIWNRYMEK